MKENIEKFNQELKTLRYSYDEGIKNVFKKSFEQLKKEIPDISDIKIVLGSSYNDEGGTYSYTDKILVTLKKTTQLQKTIEEEELEVYDDNESGFVFCYQDGEEFLVPLSKELTDDLDEYLWFLYEKSYAFKLMMRDDNDSIDISKI